MYVECYLELMPEIASWKAARIARQQKKYGKRLDPPHAENKLDRNSALQDDTISKPGTQHHHD